MYEDELKYEASTTELPSDNEKSNSATQSSRINNRKMNLDEKVSRSGSDEFNAEHHHDGNNVGTALGFIVPIAMILGAVLWVFYAYRNPHTKSGQLLIQVSHMYFVLFNLNKYFYVSILIDEPKNPFRQSQGLNRTQIVPTKKGVLQKYILNNIEF